MFLSGYLVRRVNVAIVAAVCAGIAVLTPIAAGAPLVATSAAGTYLALGDSVAFGYQPSGEVPPPDYNDPASFESYANDVGSELHLQVVNASCPGETTISMLAVGGQSNGCENAPGSTVGYRSAYPLHVSYSGTQEAFAEHYLSTHPQTKLVTINIGANDGFVCEETTPDHCVSEFGQLLTQVTDNLSAILGGLRDVGGYQGYIVVVDYYSTTYTDKLAVAETQGLNKAINDAARKWDAVPARGFEAFQQASVPSRNPCTAGLLIKLPGGTCDVHPTAAGHLALAAAITEALAGAGY
jgi:lysophospholipase L1-like esterase